jgi:hypothetical protein
MVHRLSVASRDRGAESSVYAAAPSASVGRDDRAAGTPRGGGGRRAVGPARLVPWAAVRRGRARHDGPARRRGGCRPARWKMVCKGHPCIYTADGDSMTQFASSKVVPCGHRRPGKLSDVHGREG